MGPVIAIADRCAICSVLGGGMACVCKAGMN